jgi:hypothetical protein
VTNTYEEAIDEIRRQLARAEADVAALRDQLAASRR